MDGERVIFSRKGRGSSRRLLPPTFFSLFFSLLFFLLMTKFLKNKDMFRFFCTKNTPKYFLSYMQRPTGTVPNCVRLLRDLIASALPLSCPLSPWKASWHALYFAISVSSSCSSFSLLLPPSTSACTSPASPPSADLLFSDVLWLLPIYSIGSLPYTQGKTILRPGLSAEQGPSSVGAMPCYTSPSSSSFSPFSLLSSRSCTLRPKRVHSSRLYCFCRFCSRSFRSVSSQHFYRPLLSFPPHLSIDHKEAKSLLHPLPHNINKQLLGPPCRKHKTSHLGARAGQAPRKKYVRHPYCRSQNRALCLAINDGERWRERSAEREGRGGGGKDRRKGEREGTREESKEMFRWKRG